MCRIEKINIKCGICLASVVWLCFVHGCGMVPQRGGRSHEGDRALALLSIRPVAKPDYGGYADANEWWDDLTSGLNIEFWRLCWSEDNEEHLRRLIHQFGKRGPVADMKLCIADASVMIPQEYEQPAQLFSSDQREKTPELEKIAAKYREILNLVSKIQVEMFLENPNALERYYNAAIWSRQFLRSFEENEWWSFIAKFVGLDEFWHSFDYGDVDYWWYAREFILLAHATGRDDLLRDGDATDLYSRYEKWRAWVDTNIWGDNGWTRFFPHPEKPIWVERDSLLAEGRPLLKKPTLPFPDWDANLLSPPPAWSLSTDPFSPLAFLFGDEIPVLEDHAVCGKSAGIGSHVSELPYFGKAISEFPAEGEIVYASLDYCCGADPCIGKYAEVLFAGLADKADLMEYCRKNGWSFTSAGAYTDYWSDTIRRHANSIDPKDFPIASTSQDCELFKDAAIFKGECRSDPAQLRINYSSKEKRFIGHAWCLIRSSQSPEEGQEQE